MSNGLRAAALRLPAKVREIKDLLAKDENFRSICDDLATAEIALGRVDQMPEALRAERRREYESLVESLTAEIEDALRRAKVIPITGARRHPEQ
jgi:hypothetical protein